MNDNDWTNAYDYILPQELIAQYPTEKRDHSRLLVIPMDTNTPFVHAYFYDLPSFLREGDLLIRNNVRVFPARLIGRRPGGGKAELLLVRHIKDCSQNASEEWLAFAKPANRLKEGMRITIGNEKPSILSAILLSHMEENEGRTWHIRLETDYPNGIRSAIDKCGQLPLPPYIHRPNGIASPEDVERYQTIYAGPSGAVAAPTAGLHFTEETDIALQKKGIENKSITLYVGPGTFRPVTANRLSDHQMDSERFVVPAETLSAMHIAKKEGRRIICVGTTSVRAIESLPEEIREGDYAGESTLFIKPGFVFRWTQGLITNFHLPKSTLLALVSTLAGRERILSAYETAVHERYRFYSYGDACLIL